jgi:hypothetical protein
MAFILSTATVVSAPFANAVSVNVSVNSQQQFLYQLSNSNPVYDSLTNFQTALNITVYSPGPTYNTIQSTDCKVANTININVEPGFCGTSIPGLEIDDNFVVNSYSYIKARNTYGQETWGMTTLPKILDENGNELYTATLFRGVATGTATDETIAGVQFTGATVESNTMSVTAGFPGVGTANTLQFGRVTRVGGSTGPGSVDGQANVSIPYVQVAIDNERVDNLDELT